MPTMVRGGHVAAVARMVELRAVAEGFPFYSTLALAEGAAYTHDLLAEPRSPRPPGTLAQLVTVSGTGS